jgi:hypothetical protein
MLEQVPHVGTGPGHTEHAGLKIDHLVELLRSPCPPCAPDNKTVRGRDRPSGCSSGTPAAGVKPILVSTGLPHAPPPGSRHCRGGRVSSGFVPTLVPARRTSSSMRKHMTNRESRTVAPPALRSGAVSATPGHARQVMVKSRVETRHLGQVGKSAHETPRSIGSPRAGALGRRDLTGAVPQPFPRDSLRLASISARHAPRDAPPRSSHHFRVRSSIQSIKALTATV